MNKQSWFKRTFCNRKIEEKPYTDENELICWHYSQAKGKCVKGINLLSGLIRYGDIALPITCEPQCKDVVFCNISTRKEKRTSKTTKNQMFISIRLVALPEEDRKKVSTKI